MDNKYGSPLVRDGAIGNANHKHEPYGREVVLIRREDDDYTMVSALCRCGITLYRETTPQGTRPNWKDWEEVRS
jgi:hypothetical protein